MTEEDAKTKWCPFARNAMHSREGLIVVNRELDGHPMTYAKCIGSACMAWRWDQRGLVSALAPGAWVPRQFAKKDAPLHYEITEIPDEGHCGLAGAPK